MGETYSRQFFILVQKFFVPAKRVNMREDCEIVVAEIRHKGVAAVCNVLIVWTPKISKSVNLFVTESMRILTIATTEDLL